MEHMISVVIPCLNGADRIADTCSALIKTLDKAGYYFEIIIADDGSKDTTWDTVGRMHVMDKRVKGIRLGRNMGQQTATFSALSFSSGKWVATIDDDLAHDPGDIITLLKEAEKGFDIVFGYFPGFDPSFTANTLPGISRSQDKSRSTGSRSGSSIPGSPSVTGKKLPVAGILRRAGSAARDFFFSIAAGRRNKVRVSSFRVMTQELNKRILETRRRFIYISALALKTGARVSSVEVRRGYGFSSRYSGTSLFLLFLRLLLYYSLPEKSALFFMALAGRKKMVDYLAEKKIITEKLT